MKKSIEFDFADFAIAATLFDHVFVESLHRGDDENVNTRAVVKQLSDMSGGKSVDAEQLAQYLKISKHKAYTMLRRAQKAGQIRQVNKPEKNNHKAYLPKKRPHFLPDPEEVFHQIREAGKKVRFVHPLTDEWIVYDRNHPRKTKH